MTCPTSPPESVCFTASHRHTFDGAGSTRDGCGDPAGGCHPREGVPRKSPPLPRSRPSRPPPGRAGHGVPSNHPHTHRRGKKGVPSPPPRQTLLRARSPPPPPPLLQPVSPGRAARPGAPRFSPGSGASRCPPAFLKSPPAPLPGGGASRCPGAAAALTCTERRAEERRRRRRARDRRGTRGAKPPYTAI